MHALKAHRIQVRNDIIGERVVRVDNQHTHSRSPVEHHSVFGPVRENRSGYAAV